MPNRCKCGGTFFSIWETTTKFAVKCSNCRVVRTQGKRLKKTYDVRSVYRKVVDRFFALRPHLKRPIPT